MTQLVEDIKFLKAYQKEVLKEFSSNFLDKKKLETISRFDKCVERAIKSQTAPLTKEQLLVECKGLGFRKAKHILNTGLMQSDNIWYLHNLTIQQWGDDITLSLNGNDIFETSRSKSYRQALTVIQAHLQAKGGAKK